MFQKYWKDLAVEEEITGDRPFERHHPTAGALMIVPMDLYLHRRDDLVLRLLFPADDETAKKFEQLEKIGTAWSPTIRLICLLAFVTLAMFPAKGSLSASQSKTLVFQGRTHEYLIQTVNDSARHAVVIVLHGGDSDDKTVWIDTSLPTLGASKRFIVVDSECIGE